MAKNKVFIETSVFIRYFTRDVESKYQDTLGLFDKIESGKISPYTSNTVIQEIIYILSRHYKFPKKSVVQDVKTLFELRNMTIVDKTNSLLAIDYFSKYNIKLGDCFIATQIPKGVPIVTYDADFKKIKSIKAMTPGEVLELQAQA